MAWKFTSMDPLQKLNQRVRGWEAKGLPYWTARLAAYDAKVRAADNASTLHRLIEQKMMAEMAVYELSKGR
jgi:hypothetical protein